MEYLYAALLLHKAGKKIDEAGLKAVIQAAGLAPNEGMIKAVVAALDGVNIDDVIAKAASATVASAPAATSTAAPTAAAKAEPEEKKVSEEEAAAGLGSLFG